MSMLCDRTRPSAYTTYYGTLRFEPKSYRSDRVVARTVSGRHIQLISIGSVACMQRPSDNRPETFRCMFPHMCPEHMPEQSVAYIANSTTRMPSPPG